MKVREIISRPVISAPAETPIADVAELLAEHRISAVPVVDHASHVVGLVSEYDLLARAGRTAGDMMTLGVISVDEETDVEEVRFLLVDRRIKRVPVLSRAELVGIVSRADIVPLMAVERICQVCGEPARGLRSPERCPKCQAPHERFGQEPRNPGM